MIKRRISQENEKRNSKIEDFRHIIDDKVEQLKVNQIYHAPFHIFDDFIVMCLDS